MKKGCLLKILILSTIFFAILFYILTHKLDELVINPIKNVSTGFVLDEVEKELNLMGESIEKDSLKSSLKNFVSEVKKLIEFIFQNLNILQIH